MDRKLLDLIVQLATILILYLVAVLILYLTDNLRSEMSFRVSALILTILSLVYYLWSKDR